MTNSITQIQSCIEDYFIGTYEADVERIRKAFHPECQITGFINESYIAMDLNSCNHSAQINFYLNKIR
ncbi:MAG: hypothetical protein ACJA0H_000769 [Francisellaceae bacterium]|jgi:hypothetical protein